MNVAALIGRILLGLIFLVMGLNGFLNFLPGDLPSGPAGQFLSLLGQSRYVFFVAALQVAGGVLLLANRYVPLALVLLGPVIVNIFLFHLLMAPSGLTGAILVTILWGVVALHHRRAFSGIFVHRAP